MNEEVFISKPTTSCEDMTECSLDDDLPSSTSANADTFQQNNTSFSPNKTVSQNMDVNNTSAKSEIGEEQYLDTEVLYPVKTGDGMSAYLAYKIVTKTNISYFQRTNFSVMRRFSDFLGLHQKLSSKYVKSGRIVPPAPQKHFIDSTISKISSQQSPTQHNQPETSESVAQTADSTVSPTSCSGADFLERRRAALQRFLFCLLRVPVYRSDPDVREFLEMDAQLPHAHQTSALSSASVLRLFSRVGESVVKLSARLVDDTDVTFEDKCQQMDTLETQLRSVHATLELLSQLRQDLAANTLLQTRSMAVLSNVEEHAGLARGLAQLADVLEAVQGAHVKQARDDFVILAEHCNDIVLFFSAVKDVFQEREKAYHVWQNATQTLNKKRNAHVRLELQCRSERIMQASDDVKEWEAKSDRYKEQFERLSQTIKREIRVFDVDRVRDLKSLFLEYIASHIAIQEKVMKYWEQFIPDAKDIC